MRRLTALTACLLTLSSASVVLAQDSKADKSPTEKFSDTMSGEVIEKALSGVVKLRTVAAPGAKSNATLGAEREGN